MVHCPYIFQAFRVSQRWNVLDVFLANAPSVLREHKQFTAEVLQNKKNSTETILNASIHSANIWFDHLLQLLLAHRSEELLPPGPGPGLSGGRGQAWNLMGLGPYCTCSLWLMLGPYTSFLLLQVSAPRPPVEFPRAPRHAQVLMHHA